jgi:aspartyl-tRNA(Asn)/glutamyl-tRNA(Gln) amidotransferase subunit A
MTAPTALANLTLRTLSDLLHRRALSPVELTDVYLARIEQLNPALNAYLTLTADAARAEARAAEAELTAGTDRGPLHGIPLGIKDLIPMAGVRTTAGSKILGDWVPTEDATVVRRLHAAGAVLLGKCAMTEFATGHAHNPHYGPTRNPWDQDRTPGGSSSGSGAAVAAGLAAAALGSDTACSIRQPAAYCGLAGLRPTHGRVSLAGVVPLAWSFDTVGPLARTVEDAALVLAAIAGADAADPTTEPVPVASYRAALRPGLQGVSVGVPCSYFWDRLDAEVAAAVEAALDVLRHLGAHVADVVVPGLDEALAARGLIHDAEAYAYHATWLRERPQDYGEDVGARLRRGAAYSGQDVVEAQRRLARYVAEVNALLDEVDVLVAPTTPTPAWRFDTPRVTLGGVEEENRPLGLRLTTPFTAVGGPTLSVPCGFSAAGLPIGLQIAGRRWDEAAVLHVGHAYEQATDWHTRRPPLAAA